MQATIFNRNFNPSIDIFTGMFHLILCYFNVLMLSSTIDVFKFQCLLNQTPWSVAATIIYFCRVNVHIVFNILYPNMIIFKMSVFWTGNIDLNGVWAYPW